MSTNTQPGTDYPDVHDLNNSQRDVLTVLYRIDNPEPHGRAIKEGYEKMWGREIQGGQLYPALNTLESKGYIKISKRDGRSNVYRLTELGKDLYATYEQAVCNLGRQRA